MPETAAIIGRAYARAHCASVGSPIERAPNRLLLRPTCVSIGQAMNDPLFGNKVAGAVLASMLLFFGLPQLADALLGGGATHGGHAKELKLAYPIEFKAEGGGSTGPAAVADLGALLAAASPDAGKRRAALCTSCHNFEKGGANLQGPNLWGLVGRTVGASADFNYSSAIKGLGGAWSFERLNDYIASPAKYAPGTAMSFAGIPKAEQRAELLAYLASLADSPVPFPAPAEVAATGAKSEVAADPAPEGAEPSPGETAPADKDPS